MSELKNAISFLRVYSDELTPEEELRHRQNRIKLMNERKGNLIGFHCSICNDKGVIYHLVQRDNPLAPYDTKITLCKCNVAREAYNKARDTNLGKYLKLKLSDYKTSEEWQKVVKGKVKNYIDNHLTDDKWWAMLGQSGSGKTMLTSIICNEMINKQTFPLYITWTDFISQFKRLASGSDEDKEEASEWIESIKNVQVLFIDELLKIYNDTDLKYIVEIINYRYMHELKTLITSEKTFSELQAIDEATFSRVVECCNGFECIVNIGKDMKKNYRTKGLIEL